GGWVRAVRGGGGAGGAPGAGLLRDRPPVDRAHALSACRPEALPAGDGPRVLPRPPAGRPSRRVRRCGDRLDASPPGARLRAPEYFGAAALEVVSELPSVRLASDGSSGARPQGGA